MKTVDEYKADIAKLLEQLKEETSAEKKQIILDTISADRKAIDVLQAEAAQVVVPIVGAKTVAERKITRNSIFNENRIRI
jgi:DNA polymerase III delta prime subunit